MAVQTDDTWTGELADRITTQLHQVGITVVTVPVASSTPPAGVAYDMALISRQSSPFQTVTASWFSDGQGVLGADDSEDWSNFDDPQVDQLFTQAAQALNPVTGGTIYDQIDDQLWDQMVSLPLFAEPGFEANGVQLSNVEYNPSTDGVLWNLPLWTTLEPGPASRQA
jgi:ABC-type transport system substrate-binding protein